ncbi:hypothetical protein Cch01nite_31840 [Cellulomonas chitinilytica]|uniref:Uncharacterized protein n=1 Tax=Cellulomonas chitinilytica TaxID=398759 RepID=A0A919U049_9CELL|nr:hypothetical protein [Cellulomonas chitinilytica]GIG22460.1 hypothetical protein Cch01nite_31840 [Cellulomonas chitinilytica]
MSGPECGCACPTCLGHVVVVPLPEGEVHATYTGGPYVDLSFGRPGRAVEVVNVWDYAAGRALIPPTSSPAERRRLVAAVVRTWAQDIRDDWPDFYDTYAAQ